MIIILKEEISEQDLAETCLKLDSISLKYEHVKIKPNSLLVIASETAHIPSHVFNQLKGVAKVVRLHPQAISVATHKHMPLKLSNGVTIGSNLAPVFIAGPCSVEGEVHLLNLARQVKSAGAVMLRGGAYKPRTSPYDFQGLGLEGLKYLRSASQATGMPVVSEVMSAEQVEIAGPYIDMLQIGARNMHNYELLKEVGKSKLPILLKRSMSATVNEWLNAAEYIMQAGNNQIVLCERGIRSFDTYSRNTLDLSVVAHLKSQTNLPVIVDPSHGTGRSNLVAAMSRAAIACGADGLMIEVHDNPSQALSDAEQAITPAALKSIIEDAKKIHEIVIKPNSAVYVSDQTAHVSP